MFRKLFFLGSPTNPSKYPAYSVIIEKFKTGANPTDKTGIFYKDFWGKKKRFECQISSFNQTKFSEPYDFSFEMSKKIQLRNIGANYGRVHKNTESKPHVAH